MLSVYILFMMILPIAGSFSIFPLASTITSCFLAFFIIKSRKNFLNKYSKSTDNIETVRHECHSYKVLSISSSTLSSIVIYFLENNITYDNKGMWLLLGVISLFSFILNTIFSSWLFISNSISKNLNILLLEQSIQKERDEINSTFEKLIPDINYLYSKYEKQWNMPDSRINMVILRFNSHDSLSEAQISLPEEWFLWADDCNCWIDNNILYLLEYRSSVEKKAKFHHNLYDSPEKLEENILHIAIPIHNILFFKVYGNISHSEKILRPSDSKYIGVSINGMHFGEIQNTPALTIPDYKDTRYIALYYRTPESTQTNIVFFSYDCYDSLLDLIPNLEKID